jgi:NAD(P)-dependent dehydrogenase (short-subunit alcohol dehydrogenase family)
MREGGVSRAVLVTGCSSGIGRATALRLVRAGWPVYATARRPETLQDLTATGCRVLALDVTDERSMRAAVETVREETGAVGVLINNAGYSQSGAVESVPLELARRQFETNVFGLLQCTLLVLPGMREQGWGRIVNLSSMGGKLTFPGSGLYHASKHAVEALSDALRFEVYGFGVDVVVIEPGLIRTGFGETAAASTGADGAGRATVRIGSSTPPWRPQPERCTSPVRWRGSAAGRSRSRRWSSEQSASGGRAFVIASQRPRGSSWRCTRPCRIGCGTGSSACNSPSLEADETGQGAANQLGRSGHRPTDV